MFFHDVSTPIALSTVASAWFALEQWVFTLPSVQPIAIAVSAVSNPSQ
jgi:hypothetical protein